MKKQQTGSKKLTLSKETLAQVVHVTGGSQINDTVYHPPKQRSTDYGCGIA
ncbi:MAG TPA: class I lanthipeptide [Thermoanaerobaculia bacterium]|nr:class I lanthipeptide [Thermoanaerobaculia bacterium]